MPRRTLRLDDEVDDDLAQFAGQSGVTVTAFVQAQIEHSIERWKQNDRTPPTEWHDERAKAAWDVVLRRAREIDYERRQRPRD